VLNVVDLMASLKKSLEGNKAKGVMPSARRTSGNRAASANPKPKSVERKKPADYEPVSRSDPPVTTNSMG
jgi:hypothetical protein